MIHRTAWVALISILVLVFVGAIVRATGSGLGCPDWPKCWGQLIPPTSADQIDVDLIDIEKYKKHGARHGIDPDTITRDTVLLSFNSTHTWIEFINRLTSMPLGISCLLLAIFSFFAKQNKGWIIVLSWLSLIDVLVNAWMGAEIVRSGLKPGVITTHLALAFVLICFLVTIVWLSKERKRIELPSQSKRWVWLASILFFVFLVAEGIMGSQVRELTDELAKNAGELSRAEWIGVLSSEKIYLVHRSFSWSLLIASVAMLFFVRNRASEPKVIFGLIIAMMIMGIILGHIEVFPVVQVLHVGLTSVLVAVTWGWLLRLKAATVA